TREVRARRTRWRSATRSRCARRIRRPSRRSRRRRTRDGARCPARRRDSRRTLPDGASSAWPSRYEPSIAPVGLGDALTIGGQTEKLFLVGQHRAMRRADARNGLDGARGRHQRAQKKAGRRGARAGSGPSMSSRWPGLNWRPTVYETVALPLSYSGKVGGNWYPRQVNRASGAAGEARASLVIEVPLDVSASGVW